MIRHLASGFVAVFFAASASANPAPDCRLSRYQDGTPLNIAGFKGKVTYVDFWASWCGPCLQSFPFMAETYKEFKPKGFELIAVNLDEEREAADAFLAKQHADFTIASDPAGDCPRQYDVQAMPSSFLIDRKGNIRHVHLGFREKDKAEIRAQIEALLSEP